MHRGLILHRLNGGIRLGGPIVYDLLSNLPAWVVMTMDVFEAVDSRLSCRWFLDKPVDPKIVRDLIARAARAASGGNLQPWHVYALTGAPLAELKRRVAGSYRRPRSAPRRRRISDLSEDDVGAL